MRQALMASLICTALSSMSQGTAALDSTFGYNGLVGSIPDAQGQAVCVQPDGKILVGGAILTSGGECLVARFDSSGFLDQTFGSGGLSIVGRPDTAEWIIGMDLQPDGKIVAVGYTIGNVHRSFLIRLNVDGSLDTAFGDSGFRWVDNLGPGFFELTGVVVQQDSKILACGFQSFSSDSQMVVMRFDTLGNFDPSFSQDGVVTKDIGSGGTFSDQIALQDDGKILVSGCARLQGQDRDFAVVRLNTDGSDDNGFGTNGAIILPSTMGTTSAADVVLQLDGSILLSGYGDAYSSVVRLDPTGALDATYSSGGQAIMPAGTYLDEETALAIDGGLFMSGSFSDSLGLMIWAAKLTGNGSWDSAWSGSTGFAMKLGVGIESCKGIAVQPDGKVLLTGYFSPNNRHLFLARLQNNPGLVGYDNVERDLRTSVRPNPTDRFVRLEGCPMDLRSISVFAVGSVSELRQSVEWHRTGESEIVIDLAKLSAGYYLIRLLGEQESFARVVKL